MAKLNICDLCKKPADTDHRLSLFKKTGKKHEGKKLFEICQGCFSTILGALNSAPDKPVYLVQSGNVARMPVQVEVAKQDTAPTIKTNTDEVSPGIFKVASNVTLEEVKKINKEIAKSCKHEKMTMDDDGRVVCAQCRKNVED